MFEVRVHHDGTTHVLDSLMSASQVRRAVATFKAELPAAVVEAVRTA